MPGWESLTGYMTSFGDKTHWECEAWTKSLPGTQPSPTQPWEDVERAVVREGGEKKGNGLLALGLNMKLNVLAPPPLGRALKALCLSFLTSVMGITVPTSWYWAQLKCSAFVPSKHTVRRPLLPFISVRWKFVGPNERGPIWVLSHPEGTLRRGTHRIPTFWESSWHIFSQSHTPHGDCSSLPFSSEGFLCSCFPDLTAGHPSPPLSCWAPLGLYLLVKCLLFLSWASPGQVSTAYLFFPSVSSPLAPPKVNLFSMHLSLDIWAVCRFWLL